MKKVGFHKKKGAIPHFKKILKSRTNQTKDNDIKSNKLVSLICNLKIDSEINQSSVKNFKKKIVKNKNKNNDVSREIQKKKIKDLR